MQLPYLVHISLTYRSAKYFHICRLKKFGNNIDSYSQLEHFTGTWKSFTLDYFRKSFFTFNFFTEDTNKTTFFL